MRVIGIDPGTAICGYGVVERNGSRLKVLTYGVIRTSPQWHMAARLAKIYKELTALIEKYEPERMGVEKLFFNRNVTTGIPVAQARGVILLVAELAALPLSEYTPNEIKQGVVGYGHADKHQMIAMVMRLLGIRETIRPDDAADALAVAICTLLRERQTMRQRSSR